MVTSDDLTGDQVLLVQVPYVIGTVEEYIPQARVIDGEIVDQNSVIAGIVRGFRTVVSARKIEG